MEKTQPRSVVVLPDMHVPDHDKHTWDAVLGYIEDTKPDTVVQIGDLLSLDCISAHNKGKPRLNETKRVERDYAAGHKVWSDLRGVVGPKTTLYYLEGNHEERMQRYIDEHPEVEGMLEVPQGLGLEGLGVEWIPFWSKGTPLKIGKALFIHGIYTNEHHAKKHVQAYGHSVFYGHTHDVQCYSQVMRGDNKTLVGQSLGCLCEYGQTYMKGRPDKWQQAIGQFYFHADRFYTYYVIPIFQHRFTVGGKEYKG